MKTRNLAPHVTKLSHALTTAVLLTGAAVLTLPTLARAGEGNQDNPGILPPQSKSHGKSYGEWAAAWWQWTMGVPADQSPLLDETGAFGQVGQSGSVWFLAGSFSGAPTERTITIPPGKALFFPVLNNAWFQFCTDDPLPADCVQNNYECLREQIRLPADAAVNCEIDGKSVNNLAAYHVESPAFGLNTTEGSLAAAFGFPVCLNAPCVDDGYYLMLAPLNPGAHTIHFTGTNGDFGVDVTYHLTVGDK
jgi:hypothetical protein